MAVEAKALAIPEVGAQAKDRKKEMSSALESIDRRVLEAVKRGRFRGVGVTPMFKTVRSAFEADRALGASVEQDINAVFIVLQSQSEAVFGSERIPGSTVLSQIASLELMRGIGGNPEHAYKRKRMIERTIGTKGPVTIILDSQLHKTERPIDRIAPRVVAGSKQEITEAVISSAKATISGSEIGRTGTSELLRSLSKKQARLSALPSGFGPWLKFAGEYVSAQKEPTNGTSNISRFETRVLSEMHAVVLERLLVKLMESLLESPALTIVRQDPTGIVDTRVQVMNLLGQGIEVNHVLVDPQYFTDLANQVFWGTEFVGLADSSAFLDVGAKIEKIVGLPGRDFGLYARLVYSLIDSGLIIPGKAGLSDQFTSRTLETIIGSAKGSDYYEQLIMLLHSSHLITAPVRRQLMLQSGGK